MRLTVFCAANTESLKHQISTFRKEKRKQEFKSSSPTIRAWSSSSQNILRPLHMNNQKTNTRFIKPKTVHFIAKKYIKNTCIIKNINIKIRENHSRTRKPRKTNFGKIGTVYPQPVLWWCLWGFKVYDYKNNCVRKTQN